MGATRNQIGILMLCEAGWITLLGNLLGSVGGLALSLILIFVINKQSFFWSIQFDFSGMVFLRTFAIVTLTAILAGYFPARNAAGGNISEAVGGLEAVCEVPRRTQHLYAQRGAAVYLLRFVT